ncbi:hypothetical protein CY35_12G116300 [Sphagnum magellanicum]|nr:hypothetical protein CY35_12G116300 [Sphagnum magellanicum]
MWDQVSLVLLYPVGLLNPADANGSIPCLRQSSILLCGSSKFCNCRSTITSPLNVYLGKCRGTTNVSQGYPEASDTNTLVHTNENLIKDPVTWKRSVDYIFVQTK